MRFMVIVKADKNSETGVLPTKETKETFAAMGKFNEELVKAGVMLAGEGLQPSSKGKRVRFSGQQRTVVDGPFAETKELIAGFWLWQVKSMEEAVEWLKRAPFDGGTEVEIRQSTRRDFPQKCYLPRMRRASRRCATNCVGRPQNRSRDAESRTRCRNLRK